MRLRELVAKFGVGRRSNTIHPYYHQVDHGEFDTVYDQALRRTATKPSLWRRDRFYNLYRAVQLVRGSDGAVVDCGLWRGLSLLTISAALRRSDPNFTGRGLIGIDSFEGLSQPSARDGAKVGGKKGDFEASLETVRANIAEYPDTELVRGWIPDVLSQLPERRYRLAHIDLDLVEPTLGAIDYFRTRMAPGGVLICDDYASVNWPGTKNSVDHYCLEHRLRYLPLSTCQMIAFF